jgi:predicted secreted protein
MNRRKFLSITTLTAITLSTNPLNAKELTYIAEKDEMRSNPIKSNPWKLETKEEVIEALYGKSKLIQKSDKVKIKAPKLAENRDSIPINIASTIDAKRILILQDSNKYALTGIIEVQKDTFVDYSLSVKQREIGYLTIVIEDIYGLLYTNEFEIDTGTLGHCGR